MTVTCTKKKDVGSCAFIAFMMLVEKVGTQEKEEETAAAAAKWPLNRWVEESRRRFANCDRGGEVAE
jgi:hypothetical protein